ncbi:hypothetical protein ABKA04_009308 [Annulohypoxylon sp. FPYF3050]
MKSRALYRHLDGLFRLGIAAGRRSHYRVHGRRYSNFGSEREPKKSLALAAGAHIKHISTILNGVLRYHHASTSAIRQRRIVSPESLPQDGQLQKGRYYAGIVPSPKEGMSRHLGGVELQGSVWDRVMPFLSAHLPVLLPGAAKRSLPDCFPYYGTGKRDLAVDANPRGFVFPPVFRIVTKFMDETLAKIHIRECGKNESLITAGIRKIPNPIPSVTVRGGLQPRNVRAVHHVPVPGHPPVSLPDRLLRLPRPSKPKPTSTHGLGDNHRTKIIYFDDSYQDGVMSEVTKYGVSYLSGDGHRGWPRHVQRAGALFHGLGHSPHNPPIETPTPNPRCPLRERKRRSKSSN